MEHPELPCVGDSPAGAGRIYPGDYSVYYLGVAVCAGLLFYENWLMRKADLEKVGVAFMTMNGIISVVFLFFTTLSLVVP